MLLWKSNYERYSKDKNWCIKKESNFQRKNEKYISILIKKFLAIYNYLFQFLLESNQSIEDFQIIINNNLKKLDNENNDLIFYLVINDYNFNEEIIEQARFSLSVNTANTI